MTIQTKEQMEKKEKLYDKDGTELFVYKIDVCVVPKRIEYIAESKKEAKQLFLENNKDLEECDIEVKRIK